MIDTAKIEEITRRFVEGTDMFLVEIKSTPGNEIEVVIDSDTAVSIDKCVELSRAINDSFDRDVEDFELTVSSFGIGQPLKLLRQYTKIMGKTVDVVLKNGMKITGTLTRADENGISLEYSEKQAVEGKKRKQTVDVSRSFAPDEIKSVSLHIDFK